jgi:hypothetical protein
VLDRLVLRNREAKSRILAVAPKPVDPPPLKGERPLMRISLKGASMSGCSGVNGCTSNCQPFLAVIRGLFTMFGPTGLGAVYDSGSDLVSPSDTGYCRGGDEIASGCARSEKIPHA